MGADVFEIVVKGTLSPTFSAAFEGFEVTSTENGETHLVGWVPDQARLHGALEMLRDLGIQLISVQPASGTSRPASDAEAPPARAPSASPDPTETEIAI